MSASALKETPLGRKKLRVASVVNERELFSSRFVLAILVSDYRRRRPKSSPIACVNIRERRWRPCRSLESITGMEA
jgi:hypothetical protein